jgi:L-rhamnose mutarotase
MEHVVFVQKVKKDKKDEYIKIHKEAWRELLIETKKAGFERQILWLMDDSVIVYSMAENFDRAMYRLKSSDIFKKWQATMDELLEEAQDYSENGQIIELEKIFDLEFQLDNLENHV